MKTPAKKPTKQHSLKERAHLRAVKRRSGPSAVRRRERRAGLQPVKCDGNHGGPRCADPNCWNDTADRVFQALTAPELSEMAESPEEHEQ
jgi:hypothetical protein